MLLRQVLSYQSSLQSIPWRVHILIRCCNAISLIVLRKVSPYYRPFFICTWLCADLILQLVLSSLNQISKTNDLKFAVYYFPNFGYLFCWQGNLLVINNFRRWLWWNLPHIFLCEKILYRLISRLRFAKVMISWTLLYKWWWVRVIIRIIVTILPYLICNS